MRRAGFVLAAVTVAGAVVAVAPWPAFSLWTARLAVLELSTVFVILGVAGVVLARGRWRAASAAALAVHAWPVVAAVPLYARHDAAFSLVEHVGAWPARDVVVERDVTPEPSRPDLRVDLYTPPRPTRKLLLVVHGGSWRGGDKGFAPHLSQDAAARGWRVADLTYRLAPEHRFPAAVADVKCLAGRLRERFEPETVAWLGRSAGGQIALVAAAVRDIAPACAVPDVAAQKAVGVYAPLDLAWGHANPQRPDVVDGPRSLELYLGGTPAQVPDAYRRASPFAWPAATRALLVHGTGDRLVRSEHAERFHALVPAAELLLVPGAEHGFDVRRGGVAEQLARRVILDFLDR